MRIDGPQITGSFSLNGDGVQDLDSLVTTSSLNTYTSSMETTMGHVNTATHSLNTFTSSATTRLNSIEGVTGSYATTGSNLFKGTQTLSGSLVPAVDNTYDLGSLTHQFRDLYLSSASLYIDGTKVLSSTTQELQITTDAGQSFKILEAGSDTITLQAADGNITFATSGGGDVILDPTNGIIALKGTTTLYAGNRILSSDGNAIQIGNSVTMTGSLVVTGFIETQELRTTYISSSILYRSGSTKFGDELGDTHSFTGSLLVSGSISVPGSGLISGSSQVDVMSTTNIARLSTTGSNTFSGIQTFNTTTTENAIFNSPTNGGFITLKENDTITGYLQWGLTLSGNTGGNYMLITSAENGGNIALQTRTTGGTYNNSALVINSSGNVGIGANSPRTRLQVTPQSNGEVPVLGTATGVATFTSANTNYGLQFNSTSDGTFHIQSQRFDNISTAYNLVLNYAGGNVGIGVSPSFPLDMLTSSSGTFNTIAQFQNTDFTTNNKSFIRVRQWINAGGSSSSYFGTGQDGNLYIIANDSARGGDLIINAGNGNIGIGGNSAGSKLDVNGSIYANGDIRSQGIFRDYQGEALIQTNTSAVTIIGSSGASTSRSLAFFAGNSQSMVISTSGQVGIGTGSPARQFVVSNGGANGLEITPVSSGTIMEVISYNRSTSAYTPLQFQASGYKFTGNNSSSVPLFDLVASGTGTFQRGVRLLNSGMNSGDHIMMSVGQADGARNMGQMYFQYNGAGSTSNRLSFGLHSVDDVLNISGAGRVGIGITTPSAILQVRGPNATGVFFDAQNDGAAGATFSRIGNSFPFNQYTFANGNVGIGTSSPQQTLSVEGSIRANRSIYNWYQAGTNAWDGFQFLHLKTNMWAGGSPNGNIEYTMSLFYGRLYSYSSAYVREGHFGFHNWSGGIYQSATNGTFWSGGYTSSDGYVVLVVALGGGTYFGVTIDWHQAYGYPLVQRTVTASSPSNSSSGVY